jgi:hypothetical protein
MDENDPSFLLPHCPCQKKALSPLPPPPNCPLPTARCPRSHIQKNDLTTLHTYIGLLPTTSVSTHRAGTCDCDWKQKAQDKITHLPCSTTNNASLHACSKASETNHVFVADLICPTRAPDLPTPRAPQHDSEGKKIRLRTRPHNLMVDAV